MTSKIVISLRGDVEWPAHSSDLSICDFFLLGHLKNNVFKDLPHTLEYLKGEIKVGVRAIPIRMCRQVVENYRSHLQECIVAEGCCILEM